MKTWTLVWFLIFPPNDAGEAKFEMHSIANLSSQQCFEMLAEKDNQFLEEAHDGKLAGHEIYCREEARSTD